MTTGDDPETIKKAMKAATGCPPEKQLGSGYEKRIVALEGMIGQLRGALYEWQGNAHLLQPSTKALLEMTSFDSELLPIYCDERDHLRAEVKELEACARRGQALLDETGAKLKDREQHLERCRAENQKMRTRLNKSDQLLKMAQADMKCYTATATRLMKELIDAGVGSHPGSFSHKPNTLAGMTRAAIQRIKQLEDMTCGTCHGLGEVHVPSRWDPADVHVYECLECGEAEAKQLRAEVSFWRGQSFVDCALAVLTGIGKGDSCQQ